MKYIKLFEAFDMSDNLFKKIDSGVFNSFFISHKQMIFSTNEIKLIRKILNETIMVTTFKISMPIFYNSDKKTPMIYINECIQIYKFNDEWFLIHMNIKWPVRYGVLRNGDIVGDFLIDTFDGLINFFKHLEKMIK